MLTITRKDLSLTINDNVIPAMGSSDVPVKFVNDTETYAGFLIEPRVGYYVNGCPKSVVCEYSSNTIKIPAEAFKNKGILVIAIALIDNNDSNHIEVTKELALEVTPAPNGTVIFPATDTWQTAVNNLVEQLYNQDYKPQFDEIEENLHNLVKEAQNQQNKANNQQTQIDNAIDVMGDYEIVQDNPTQIRFKKGDGTYGDTVNLGDNLASKSMVNAGYDTYSGNSYSGSASDYGIEIGKASGSYEQVTTNGYQLFDQSKLSDVTSLGVTLKNNGDGSFTITGSGNITGLFSWKYDLTDEEFSKLCKDQTKVSLNNNGVSNPSFMLVVQKVSDNTVVASVSNGKTVDVSSFLSADYRFRFQFYGAGGSTIVAGIVKPMLYCQGDGTWEPFTGGEPSPNPDYKQEPKFFEPKNVNTNGGNLFDASKIPNKTQGGATVTNNGDGSFTISGSGNLSSDFNTNAICPLKVKAGKCILECFADKGTYPYFEIQLKDEGGTIIKTFVMSSTTNTHEVTLSEEEAQKITKMNIYFYGYSGKPIVTGTIKPMLYQDGDGAWLPYNADSTPLDITLRALPNGVCDTYENGVITRRIGEITFDGGDDENWMYFNTNCNQFYIVVDGITYNNITPNTLCAYFKSAIIGDRTSTKEIIYTTSNGIGINTDLETSVAEWKTYLQSHPIKVWYELAEPTIEQVDLPIIPSYFPYTNAWHDSPLQPQITWNVLTGRSAILDGNGDIVQNGYMTPQDNLLINSDFRSGIINQKGITSLDKSDGSTELGIDGWIQYGINIAVGSNYVTFANRTNTTHTVQQPLDIKGLKAGDKVTFYASCFNITGNVYIYMTGLDAQKKKLVNGDNEFTFTLTSALERFYIELAPNTVVSFNCMKLEPGEHFTGMPCWNYAMELLKCQNKFEVKSIACFAIGGTFQQFHATESASYFFCGDYTWIEKDKIPTVEVKEISTNEGVISGVSVTTISITKNGCIGFRSNIPIGRPYLLLKCWIDAYNYG